MQEYLSRAFLGDGLGWNWSIRREQFPGCTPILDFIHRQQMKYPEYRRCGLPVTTAWMESLVKEMNYRVKGTEMFWNDPEGAEAILQVRAASLSDDARTAFRERLWPIWRVVALAIGPRMRPPRWATRVPAAQARRLGASRGAGSRCGRTELELARPLVDGWRSADRNSVKSTSSVKTLEINVVEEHLTPSIAEEADSFFSSFVVRLPGGHPFSRGE